jgi:hypothetical protein
MRTGNCDRQLSQRIRRTLSYSGPATHVNWPVALFQKAGDALQTAMPMCGQSNPANRPRTGSDRDPGRRGEKLFDFRLAKLAAFGKRLTHADD